MYLSRLILNPRNKRARRDLVDCGEMHRTVMNAFPPGIGPARSQFGVLHRVDVRSDGEVTLFVQSRQRPDWSHLPPDYLLDQPACKPVASIYAGLTAGSVLRFRLRANPTRKIDTKSDASGRRRHGRRVEFRTEAECTGWLQRKAQAGGFELLSVRLNPAVPDVTARPEGSSIRLTGTQQDGTPRPLTFAAVLFEGHLRVTDVDQFLATLEKGIGPGKAYGLGLLSVAAPSG